MLRQIPITSLVSISATSVKWFVNCILMEAFCIRFQYNMWNGMSETWSSEFIALVGGAQILGTKLHGHPNFLKWHPAFMDPQYGTCFMQSCWHPEFLNSSWIYRKFVHPLSYSNYALLLIARYNPEKVFHIEF